MKSVRVVSVIRHGSSKPALVTDCVAVEEPLEIRIDGQPLVTLMRTPDDDLALTIGLLITERVIRSLADVRKIDVRKDENRSLVFLADGFQFDARRMLRNVLASSSCGICSKTTLDAILEGVPPVHHPLEVGDAVLLETPGKLLAAQAAFAQTGGLHGAGLFNARGDLLISCEDIGRHNAVDKVIGKAHLEGVHLEDCLLLVSGRVSFEILQKSLVAGISVIAAISAPSSLAVEFARRCGQRLIAFLRPPDFSDYTSSSAD